MAAAFDRRISDAADDSEEETALSDIVFLFATLVFFLLSIGYLRACERLK